MRCQKRSSRLASKLLTGFTFIEMMITLVLIGLVILPTSYVYRNTVRTWLINKASLQIRRTAREGMDYINKDFTAAEGASVMAVGPVSDAIESDPDDPWKMADTPVNIEEHPLVNPGLEQDRSWNRRLPRGWKAKGTRKYYTPDIKFDGNPLYPWTWFQWHIDWIENREAIGYETDNPRACQRVSYITKEGNYSIILDCPGSGEAQYFSLPFKVPQPAERHILVGDYRGEAFCINALDLLGGFGDWLESQSQKPGWGAILGPVVGQLKRWTIISIGEGTFGIDLVNLDDTENYYKTAPNQKEVVKWFQQPGPGDWCHLNEIFKPASKGITSETKVRLKCRVNFELDRTDFESKLINRVLVALVSLFGGGNAPQISLAANLFRGYFDCMGMVREEMVLVDVSEDRLNEPPDPELDGLSGEKVTFQIKRAGGKATAYRYLIKDASYTFEGRKIRNYQLWRQKHAGDWVADGYNPIAEYVTYFKVHGYHLREENIDWEFEVTLECARENPDSPGRWLSSGRQVVMIRPIIPSRY